MGGRRSPSDVYADVGQKVAETEFFAYQQVICGKNRAAAGTFVLAVLISCINCCGMIYQVKEKH